jgi:hypothetical protein
MMTKKNSSSDRGNKGLSTVFGSVLFIILFTVVASALFVAFFNFDKNTQTSVLLEEKRNQEKIAIDDAQLIKNGNEIVSFTAIHVTNFGSATVQIRSIYIDNVWIDDPSISIQAKESSWINLPSPNPFEPTSIITVTTANGVKGVVLESSFMGPPQSTPPPEVSFGPLKLTYEDFKYNDTSSQLGWVDGWSVPRGTTLVWRIEVTNVDDKERTIDLTQFSCLTLVSNDGGGQSPWYLKEITKNGNPHSLSIAPGETVNILYQWKDPQSGNTQNIPNNVGRYRVFLTFFGYFNDQGTLQPYGQTIPFEGVIGT